MSGRYEGDGDKKEEGGKKLLFVLIMVGIFFLAGIFTGMIMRATGN